MCDQAMTAPSHSQNCLRRAQSSMCYASITEQRKGSLDVEKLPLGPGGLTPGPDSSPHSGWALGLRGHSFHGTVRLGRLCISLSGSSFKMVFSFKQK